MSSGMCAFRATLPCQSGLLRKNRFGLTQPQKYRLRKRLQGIDTTLDTLVESLPQGSCKALDLAKLTPPEKTLSPFEKYFTRSKHERFGFKPVSWIPKWTRVPHPRAWKPAVLHDKI